MPMIAPVLTAAGPAQWMAQHLAAALDERGPTDADGPWLTLADLLADDHEPLRTRHAQCLAEGATGPAAAKWVAAEIGGQVVTAVACVLGFGAAGLVVDPSSLRWRLHPDGWSDRLDIGAAFRVLVASDHPWAGRPDVEVVSPEQVGRRAMTAAAEAVHPVVEACHALAKVGRNALWAEVADGAAWAVGHRADVPVHAEVCAAVDEAMRAPGLPWRTVPVLGVVEHADGPLYTVQKGGCCLVYLSEAPDGAPHPESDLDAGEDVYAAFHEAYEKRFPTNTGAPAYCSTCSLRPLDECVERQVWHRDNLHLLPG